MTVKNKSLFWWFQISGWIVFYMIFLPLFSSGYFNSLESTIKISITMFLGFFYSYLLRLVYKRFPKHSLSPATLTIVMLAFSILASFLWVVTDYSISAAIWGITKDHIDPIEAIETLSTNSAIFFGWSLLYFSLKLLLDWNYEKKRAESALDMARTAQLQSLRYQLDAHFLFNSLNTIHVLIDKNRDSAKKVVAELSDFLRYSLVNREVVYSSLEEELIAMQHYFEIQHIRFEEQLQVEVILEEEVKTAQILCFLLHPIIENAVKYGMKTSPSPLRITVSAKKEDENLSIHVLNTGQWIEGDNVEQDLDGGTGTGLVNVRKRLEKAYPKEYKFTINKNAENVDINLVFPFKRVKS